MTALKGTTRHSDVERFRQYSEARLGGRIEEAIEALIVGQFDLALGCLRNEQADEHRG